MVSATGFVPGCRGLLLATAFGAVLFSCTKNGASPATPPPQGAPKDTTSDLRVLTYNIHHANPPAQANVIDLAGIAAVIRQQAPHLVALQEVDVRTTRSGTGIHQAEELGRLTGMKAYFAKAIDYAGGEYGVAILSRFPLSGATPHPLPLADGSTAERRTLATAVVRLDNGKEIVFASTHLDAQADPANRQLQADRIAEILKKETRPVIIGGDFNAVATTPVIASLDGWARRTCTANCGYTIPAHNPTKTIDYIAVAPAAAFTVLQHTVVDEKFASDHRPVMAVVRLH